MRRRSSALVAAALLAAACGSKANPATHTKTTTTTPTTTPTTASASATDCNTLGINPTQMREGTCTHAGITYVIVDQGHTLRLHTLMASLDGVRSTTSLAGPEPATTQGRFVVVSIKVTNRLQLPQVLDKSGTQQAGLILDGTLHKEDTGAEAHSDPRSCLSLKVSLASGRSETCQVVFQVPTASAGDLGKHGRADLYMVDFGSDLSGSIIPQTVGQIRLYR